MRYAIVALLSLTSAVAINAVAQEGGGNGPPKKSPIIVILPIPLPTPSLPTGGVQKFFQPQSELASLMK
jgi:hypothetical protein